MKHKTQKTMDREKMIQELIQKRINSNNQIYRDMEYISQYKKKKERLDTYNKHQNSLMEKVQTLSEQIEKQKEAKKEEIKTQILALVKEGESIGLTKDDIVELLQGK